MFCYCFGMGSYVLLLFWPCVLCSIIVLISGPVFWYCFGPVFYVLLLFWSWTLCSDIVLVLCFMFYYCFGLVFNVLLLFWSRVLCSGIVLFLCSMFCYCFGIGSMCSDNDLLLCSMFCYCFGAGFYDLILFWSCVSLLFWSWVLCSNLLMFPSCHFRPVSKICCQHVPNMVHTGHPSLNHTIAVVQLIWDVI